VLTMATTLLLLLFTVACGDSKSNTPTPGGEVLQELEESGAIPVLDRTATVPGVDANNDGVRDDIATYVASLPDAPTQKSALLQTHKAFVAALQAGLADSTTTAEGASLKMANAVNCLSVQYPDGYDQRIREMRRNTVNTKKRFDAYMEYTKKIDGSVLTLPEGNTCE